MTFGELIFTILNFLLVNLPFLVLYFIIGFGPGFIIGILAANKLLGYGPLYLETHEENIRIAGEHNAQWRPEHERWKK